MFLIWLNLLPQMQAFDHRLFGIWDCDKAFVTALFYIKIIIVLTVLAERRRKKWKFYQQWI